MASRLFYLFCLLCALPTTPSYAQDTLSPPPPVNVILLIGNGLGTAQVSTAFYGETGTSHFERFEHVGLTQTRSASHAVTDPAAAVTAMATGVRTYNRAIAFGPDTASVPTLLERLRDESNYRTGLVSLHPITHATPACFYAHVPDRDMQEDIAVQLVAAAPDFFVGGGLNYFTHRADGRNLYRELQHADYHLDSIGLSPTNLNRKNGYLLAPESLPTKAEGRGSYLPDAARVGLDYFSRQDTPFFFVLEGSYLDRAGHARNDSLLIREIADFDETLGVLLDYVDEHPHTLLVVAGTHETGGVSLTAKYDAPVIGAKREIPAEVAVRFGTKAHSAELVPVFARGTGAEHFSGVYPNHEIYHRLLKALEPGRMESPAR